VTVVVDVPWRPFTPHWLVIDTPGQCTACDAVGDERAGAVQLPLHRVSSSPVSVVVDMPWRTFTTAMMGHRYVRAVHAAYIAGVAEMMWEATGRM
jgi:hypothetical protein